MDRFVTHKTIPGPPSSSSAVTQSKQPTLIRGIGFEHLFHRLEACATADKAELELGGPGPAITGGKTSQ